MNSAASMTIERDDEGKFKHHGGWERLCRCGHTLGKHAAAKVKGERPCFCDEGCDCMCFRPAKRAHIGA